jgi:predicted nucleic acid-binding protein
MVLHLLVDTSVWLDLAKKRDGQKLIHALGQVMLDGTVEILVPQIVRGEFERNREHIEVSMTTSVADRFKNLQKEVEDLSAEWHRPAFEAIAGLAHEMPLIGTMATRNFTDILQLFQEGRVLEPSVDDRDRVLERGLAKRAPFLRGKNSTADAMLIEMYATFATSLSDPTDVCGFVTSNNKDFSQEKGDVRLPHPDLTEMFDGTSSRYLYGVDGLQDILDDHLGDELEQILIMSDFQEDPRTLQEIQLAEQEFYDRVWYERSVRHTDDWEAGRRGPRDTEEGYRISLSAQERARARRPDLCPAEDNFERGMWNGKLSTLRWVLGSEWDFLDT